MEAADVQDCIYSKFVVSFYVFESTGPIPHDSRRGEG